MITRFVVVTFGCLGLLASGRATAQTRDAPTAPASGTIVGVVVTDDSDAIPIRKARVMCTGPDVGVTTISDEFGRFVFTGLPAGRYTLAASKPTWVTIPYGAKRPNRPATPVALGSGQTLRLVLRMARGAAITGILLDYGNQPAANAQVQALRYRTTEGERRLAAAASTTTDERGVYRLYGLAAGEYYVAATVRNLGGMSAGELVLTSDADVRGVDESRGARSPAQMNLTVAFAPAFYPNGSSLSQASVVSVRAGEERGGIDFALQLVRTARVDGTVTLPEGGVPAGAEIVLIAGATGATWQAADGYRRSFPAGDGTFSFDGVPPGTYTLLARGSRPVIRADGSPAPSQMVWASAPIIVDGEPVTGLALSLDTGLTIAGRVRFRGAARPPAMSTVRVSAVPADPQGAVSFAPATVPVAGDGAFTIVGVIPGRYRLNATVPGAGRPGGWTLDSIVAAGGDALDSVVTVGEREHIVDALVTFTDRLSEVSGTVRSASGDVDNCTVVLFPVDQTQWRPQSRRIQASRVAADGAFGFRNVPAGQYLIAPVEDADAGEWFEPAFLQQLLPTAVRLTIAGTDPVTINLRRN